MANIGDVLKSGALGLGTAALARNPETLRGFGLAGNLAANVLEDKDEEEKKKRQAATARTAGQAGMPGMKKGGKVKKMAAGGSTKSASARADGCAQRGKTRGKIV